MAATGVQNFRESLFVTSENWTVQSPFTPAPPDSQVGSEVVAEMKGIAEQPQLSAGVPATLKKRIRPSLKFTVHF